jgi:hypothetical protein
MAQGFQTNIFGLNMALAINLGVLGILNLFVATGAFGIGWLATGLASPD